MRILDLNNCYSPVGGGIRVYHDEKLRYFQDSSEHHAALVVPATSERKLVDGRVARYELPSTKIPFTSSRFVLSSRAVARVVRDFAPDLVEIGSPYVMPFLLRRAIADRPLATVGFFHTDYPEIYVRKPLERLLGARFAGLLAARARRHAGRVYGGMTAAFAASSFALGQLRALGVSRLFRTPLGVDLKTFHPGARSEELRRQLDPSGRKRLVVYAGRISIEKGIGLLTDAYPLLRDRDRVALVVVGDGPMAKRMTPFFDRYPEVRRLPFERERGGVARLLASADVCLSLGAHETFSLATLEAIACGTPVVTAGAGGAGELVTGSGVLAPAERTPAAVAARIDEALDARTPETSDRLRRYALARHSWPQVFDRLTHCYAQVLAASSGGSLRALEPPGPWWD